MKHKNSDDHFLGTLRQMRVLGVGSCPVFVEIICVILLEANINSKNKIISNVLWFWMILDLLLTITMNNVIQFISNRKLVSLNFKKNIHENINAIPATLLNNPRFRAAQQHILVYHVIYLFLTGSCGFWKAMIANLH